MLKRFGQMMGALGLCLLLGACPSATVSNASPSMQTGKVLTPSQLRKAETYAMKNGRYLPASYQENQRMAWMWSTAESNSQRVGTNNTPQTSASGKNKIALLLPLSGQQRAVGQALLNAAQLAVFDYAASDFELLPRDTGDSAEGAVTAMRDALASGAKLIIGPLFAPAVTAIRPLAEHAQTPVLALSNDAKTGGGPVYMLGLSPADQVTHGVRYAAEEGIRHFAALVPQNAYGKVAEQAFAAAVKAAGGKLGAIERYQNSANVAASLRKIVTALPDGGVLLIADGGTDLRTIAAQFQSGGVDTKKIQLLGTGLWDEVDLGRSAPSLIGGWYAAPNPSLRRSFVNSYRNTYGSEPPRIASIAYDATAFAAQVSRAEGLDLRSFRAGATFAGIDGTLRLTSHHIAERNLSVMKITKDGSAVVSDASPIFD